MKSPVFAGLSIALLGCAGGAPMRSHDVARDAGGERAVEWQVATPESPETDRAPTITLSSPVERGETLRIGAPAEAHHSRPPVSPRLIDVDLNRAALGDALRFIADAGGFNMVLEGDPNTPVTLQLHRVDAFDALVTVAEAHGLVVDIQRGIVMVTPPLKTASNDDR